MARRTLKRSPKSAEPKPKTAQSVGLGAKYGRDVAVTGNAARGGRQPTRVGGASLRNRQSVPATQAKNRFGEILQAVRDSGPVFIERHGQTQAVVLDIDTYNKLTSNKERTQQERELDRWAREFDALHARMQTDKARQAVDALFSATDAELNRRNS